MKFTDRIKSTYAKDYKSLSDKARTWFAGLLSHMSVSRNEVLSNSTLVENFRFGKMYFFVYDPKGKDTLPYYDRFPLVLPIEARGDGFIGLNMHYIDPATRAIILDSLRDNNYDDLIVTYNQIKYNPIAKFCLKRYLISHVRSKFVEIEPVNFDWVLFLPLEHFAKKSKTSVWTEARNRY